MAPRAGRKRKPSRQISLSKKPVIDVKGKLGKAQKSKKRKIKSTFSSSVDFYEQNGDVKDKKLRPDPGVQNSAPKSLDQEVPRKLRELMQAREKLKEGSKLSNSKQKALRKATRQQEAEQVEGWFSRPVSETPRFTRRPGESDKAFYGRVETESNEFMKIAKYEQDNQCKVVTDETGNVCVERKVRRKQVKNKEHRDKLKLKKQQQQQQREHEVKDFSQLSDEVKFNERIDRPPEALAKPRKARAKDGMGDRLASFKFMDMMPATKKPVLVKSMAAQERLNEERQRAIDMYRTLKARRRTQQ